MCCDAMSRAGRPRKRLANLPPHIDADKIPRGVYWDSERLVWYVRDANASGKTSRKRVGDAGAKLSDLHQLAETRGQVDRTSLRYLCDQFAASPHFAVLAPGTRADYAYCRDVLCNWKAKTGTVGDLVAARVSRPLVQVLVNAIAAGANGKATPSKAAHVRRYLSRVWKWGCNHGHVAGLNPALGIEPPKERKRRRLPSAATMAAVVKLALERGAFGHAKTGSCAAYLWAVAEIAYLCRLRGIEVATLTEAAATKEGLRTNRRKGSRDNVVAWSPRLRAAWEFLIARRDEIWAKKKTPVPIRAEDRPLLVALRGGRLSKSSLDTAWQRLMALAIAEGVITAEERYALHDLKRAGITDTLGTRADKQEASGHRDAGMLDTYDLSVPLVPASGIEW